MEQSKKIKDLSLDEHGNKIVLCQHCGKQINQVKLRGLSLICSRCDKPQNGYLKDLSRDQYGNKIVLCQHCGKQINQVKLRALTLICPLCEKSQDGVPFNRLV